MLLKLLTSPQLCLACFCSCSWGKIVTPREIHEHFAVQGYPLSSNREQAISKANTGTYILQHTNWYVKRWLGKKKKHRFLLTGQAKKTTSNHPFFLLLRFIPRLIHTVYWVNTTLFNTRKCTCTHAQWIAYGPDECMSCTMARSYLITGL